MKRDDASLVFMFRFQCALCGGELVWQNEMGSQPQEDGSEVFLVSADPHTCDEDALRELCMCGDVLDEAGFRNVKAKASWVGWPA